MRAPITSPFLAELVAYRKAVKAVLDGAPAGPERDLVSSMLDRWQDHADREHSWDAIVHACVAHGCQPPPAQVFIAWVLRERLRCKQLADRIPLFKGTVSKARAQANRDWKADFPNAIHKRLAVEAFSQQADALLGRKKNQAPQRLFMLRLRDTFVDNYGQPLHEVVATLTSIAFGTDVTVDSVKKVAKGKVRTPK